VGFFNFKIMVKCKNLKCPIKEKCGRYVNKVIGVVSSQEFQFETVKNPDGTIRGYICQFQKFI
jgi:hypothetical protein